jgi:hypothetical protein
MKYAKYLGDLFILALIVVSLNTCAEPAAAAAPSYELALMIYNTAQGHMNAFRSYKYLIRVGPFDSLKACDAYGQYSINRFPGVKQGDLTVDMLDYLCVKLARP